MIHRATNRAIAGVSAGGYASLYLLGTRPEQFSDFGIWSAPVELRTVNQAESRYSEFIAAPPDKRAMPRQISLRAGEKDAGAASVQALSALFRKHDIAHDLRITSGGHDWAPWRRYLQEFAQSLFHPAR